MPEKMNFNWKYYLFDEVNMSGWDFCPYIARQGWLKFLSEEETIYPNLVREFYGSMGINEDRIRFTTQVKGTLIVITPRMLSNALGIPLSCVFNIRWRLVWTCKSCKWKCSCWGNEGSQSKPHLIIPQGPCKSNAQHGCTLTIAKSRELWKYLILWPTHSVPYVQEVCD